MAKHDRLREYAPIIVRLAMSLVILWFATNQFIAPSTWTSYLPSFVLKLGNPIMFIYANATFEVIFAALLIFGVFTRITALLLGLHLLAIVASLGYNEIAVRDFGLSMATLSVVFSGADKWCLDRKIWKKQHFFY